ncbi:MAG: tetratricopeptide repeat protein [Bdellovibrionales bacterium]|nr:tetratricopeptide repeat protein [Bdellovibrionales bacterium]
MSNTKCNVIARALITLVSVTVCSPSLYAAQSRRSSTKTATKANSRTVGDLLNKIEKKSERVNFEKSKSSLPAFKTQQSAAPRKVNLKTVKPPSSKKLYFEEGTDEAQLQQVTDQGIDQLYKLTQRYSKSSKRGELWLRLAEMYVEKARLIEYQILNKHDSDMQAFQEGKSKVKPKLNLTPAIAYNKKAIQLYEWFLRDFPKDPKVDQALFFLGFNHFEMGDPKKGQSYYVRLTKEFPNSQYVSESNFALGEYHFEAERWKDGLYYYSQVARQKSSRLYSFALYKMAWCYYKLNNSKKGLNYIEQVIYEGRKSKGKKDSSLGGVSRIRLATEAIKDLIIFYAEAGDYKRARSYFEEVVGQKSANANLAKLAYFYNDTGNRQAASYLFKDLISQDPNSIKAYDYQYAIVKMYGATGNSQEFKNELFGWIEQYGPSSSWQRINEKDRNSIAKANELMESLLRNHVLQQHQVAQNSRTKTSQSGAKSGYELYFNTFKNAVKIDEMHFFYAELLFDMGDYEKAAGHYMWIVDNDPKSQYYDKSLINSLLAYEKRIPSEDKIKKIVGESTEPIEFNESLKDFERAAYRFLQKAPNSENAVATKYRLGALYYLFNQFDKAIPILTDIVKKHSKTQYAQASANHLLDIYNLKKDYAGLLKTANEILAIPELARSNVGSQIKDIKLKTDFKLAKDLEDKKDYLGSAKAYEDFAMKNRASDLATGSLFNSAVNYERAGNIMKAIGIYALVAGNKAKGAAGMAEKANKFLPTLYEKTGQYDKAADLFQAYARAHPKDKLAEEYHYNAAVIYDGMNSYKDAIRNYESYFDKSRGKDRLEVLFLIAKIYERTGQKSRAIMQYDKYMKSGTSNAFRVIASSYAIAKLHESLRRKTVSEEWFQKTVDIQHRLSRRSGTPVGASYAAESKFKLVYNTYNELVAIRIPSNPSKQGAAVQKKLALLNRLKDELKKVIAYDDAFQIVAALSTQGQALQHMYAAISSTPVPKGLKPEELKQYQDGVKGIADPFRVQAIETYKTAVERGQQLQGYNEYLVSAQKNLSNLSGQNSAIYDAKAIITKLPDELSL